jgi:hypothetical protein
MQLIECLDFSTPNAFETLCSPILWWMKENRDIVRRLRSPFPELQSSDLETLWDVATKTLPEDKISLEAGYLRIPEETYKHAGIQIPK